METPKEEKLTWIQKLRWNQLKKKYQQIQTDAEKKTNQQKWKPQLITGILQLQTEFTITNEEEEQITFEQQELEAMTIQELIELYGLMINEIDKNL